VFELALLPRADPAGGTRIFLYSTLCPLIAAEDYIWRPPGEELSNQTVSMM
jgi:hypothetical protein